MNLAAGIPPAWRQLTAAAGLVWVAAGAPVRAEPVLYDGEGGWAVVAGLPESARPPGAEWRFENGLWIGRVPPAAAEVGFTGVTLPWAGARPLPLAPAVLPVTRNAFGPCVLEPLSLRYDSVVRSRPWTIVFNPEGAEPAFQPLAFPDDRNMALALAIEDVETGQRWILRPMRQGREQTAGPARFYGGRLDGGDIDWSLVVAPAARAGRYVLQGRVMLSRSAARLLRVQVLVLAGDSGKPLLQEESPPAVVAWVDGWATALGADPAEPRRFRAVTGKPGFAGLEFDLAATRATGNFPGSATFSLEVAGWPAEAFAAAEAEVLAHLPPADPPVPLPDFIARTGLAAVPRYEPARMRVAHPGGFRNSGDVMQYLMLKTAGLFPDRDWAASAFLCAARDAAGALRIERNGDEACVAVNPDPDLEAMLELGPNRGLALLADIRQRKPAAVWIKTLGNSPGLDYSARALHLCDYPAVWEAGTNTPGVDLRHAEIELLGSLSCVLRQAGICLLVEDNGPLAPFTTFHADALVCASADPAEMRRQHVLAGTRPVVWLAENPGREAEQLARDFGFVRPGQIRQE